MSGTRAGAPIIDSTAMTKVGDVDWNELLANGDMANRSESEGETGTRFRHANEPDFIPIPSTFAPIVPLPSAESSAPINKQAWQSSALAKRRQMLTLATIAVGGSLFAIVGFIGFTRMMGTKEKTNSKKLDVVQTLPELKKPDVVAIKESDPPSVPDSAPLNNDELPAANTVPANAGFESPEVKTEETTKPPTNPLRPESQQSPATPPVKADSAEEDALPDAFGNSMPLNLIETTLANLPLRDNDIVELNIEDAEVIRDQLFHPNPSAIPSWEKSSKVSFSSFRKKEISLLQCIDVFGRLTGVGVTVEWQSCRIAGIDLSEKREINFVDKSVSEMMEQIVQEYGLAWTLDPSGLPVVSAPKEVTEAKMKIDWSISGLFPTEMENRGGEDLLRLWGYDDVCRVVGGRLEWSEQATSIEKANVYSSLCQLSKLRNQDTSPWFQVRDASLVFSPNQWNSSFPSFERQISTNIIAPEKRPIADLLMLAAAETKLNLVIDWLNVWGHGLSPVESSSLVLGGRKFPQVAKRILNEYALELVPIGEDTVWLTTREVRRKQLRVVPVRLPKNFKAEDLKQNLRALAPIVDDVSKFRVIPVAGTDDLFFARICSPRVDQLNDPDLMQGLGWPDRQP